MSGMSGAGPEPKRLIAGMMIWVGILAILPLMGGGFIVEKHEGDTLHLADLVLRMAEQGQMPHTDFMTPLGILSIWPIALMVKAGLGLGTAFLTAQILLALALFAPVVYVASTRFRATLGWVYAAYTLALCLALVHGEGNAALSMSMHYNRWAWALAYLVIPLAMLEPKYGRQPVLDGVILGVALAVLGLVKATYVAAFLPVVVVALMARRDWGALGVGVLSGLAVVGVVTLVLGVEFWLAYLGDLLAVATSETRAAPGLPLVGILVAPDHILGTFTLIMAVILLRQSGRMVEGLALLILVPGFVYVTYQNYGNDPQWLVLLGLLVLGLRPDNLSTNAFGWRLNSALLVSGTLAFALAAASAVNVVWSPLRMYLADSSELRPLLLSRPAHSDLLVSPGRVSRVVIREAGEERFPVYAGKYADDAQEPQLLNGEVLPECEMTTGHNTWFETTAASLTGAGYAGSGVLIADLFTALWLYGDFKPIEGAAPWYYGGTPGLEAADHVLVPLCPANMAQRRVMLGAIEKAGWQLEEEMRTGTFVLLRPYK